MHAKLCHSDELPSGPLLAAPGQPDPIRTNQGYSAEGPFQRFDPFDPHEVAKIFQAGSVPHVDHTSADLEFVKKFTRPNFRAKKFYTLKTRKLRLFSPAINSENASLSVIWASFG